MSGESGRKFGDSGSPRYFLSIPAIWTLLEKSPAQSKVEGLADRGIDL